MNHSEAILQQQFDVWRESQQTKIFLEFLEERREKLITEIKFSAQRNEQSEQTTRRVMRLVELDDIIAQIHDTNNITEYGSRGFVNTTNS